MGRKVLNGTICRLTDLISRLRRAKGCADVVAALRSGESAGIDGAWGSSSALAAATLSHAVPQTLLVVLPRVRDVERFATDLGEFLGEPVGIFPAWERLPEEQVVADPVFGARLRMIRSLEQTKPPRLLATSITALLQSIPAAHDRSQGARTLRSGEEISLDELLDWLVSRGMERVPAVEQPGEFSVHGGIIDIYSPDAPAPFRLELFGDEIESIRTFDVETQRKIEELDHVSLLIVGPSIARTDDETSDREASGLSSHDEHILDVLQPGSWIALCELDELLEEGRNYLDRLSARRGLFTLDETMARWAAFPTVTIDALVAARFPANWYLAIESIERLASPSSKVLEELGQIVAKDEQLLIACHNEAEEQRLSEMLAETDVSIAGRVQLCRGTLGRGFRMISQGVIVLGDHELFGRADIQRAPRRRKRFKTRAIDSFLEIKKGDLVVEVNHGIARFRGMELLTKDDRVEEHLILEFAGAVRMYVPASLIHLVQKYVGARKSQATLSTLGGSRWEKKKSRVASAVRNMAADMLRLHAAREAKPGLSLPPDGLWMQEFEAAFPYTETEDQTVAIAEVKDDMERPRPMDRLICGDVGYGKTEVAMRAAFKAVEAGRQAAVLVPTTVLAEQHFRTFTGRMAEFPITIEVLSRFRSKAQQRSILKRLKAGKVDIVIGTHRLVQQDVEFQDLGLLVIDEEQRFGVEVKDTLKRMRLEVDVLTLSATPIPRTLHMALLGIRDISNLQTPPHDRMAIETRIARFDADLIRRAIVRELNRNGQIYFVHNRVYNIQSIADRIQQIVPEARSDIGHGQMNEHDLEDAMLRFVKGETDVLVATTIIESGLDIPNANTIFIHQADQFGLADLHQLRGRVGRYKNRAYCYLLLSENRTITPVAAKRLKAIEEFSELGAGFKIAMRDLEIRGAGNLLGTEQSGHISAVGYELYCRLLENAVRNLTNEPLVEPPSVSLDLPAAAFVPDTYLAAGRQKMDVYRKLSTVRTAEELADLEQELRDRFGPLPTETVRLFQLKELQLLAQGWRIHDIHLEESYAVFGYSDRKRIGQLREKCGNRLRIVDNRSAYLILNDSQEAGDALLQELKSVLQST